MRRRAGTPDYLIYFIVITLLGIGIVMVFSASAARAADQFKDPYYFLKRQLVWAMLGLLAMYFTSQIDYWHLRKLAVPGLVVTLVLLVLVLVPEIGRVANNARRWIGFGNLAFQPSELMKLTFVVYLAHFLSREHEVASKLFRGLLPVVGLTGVVFLLILAEPDLGTALAVAGTTFIMLFCGGARISHLVGLVGAAVPGFIWAVFSEEYRRKRFLAFLDPWADPSDSGYHIIQSLYALGSGQLFGLGLGQGRQKWLYLPEPHTDFIFSIIGEELGFLGTSTVVLLFFLLAWRGYRVAVTSQDSLGCLLAAGMTTMICLQALINIGVVTASIPITGIPLPFLSFGGSSLIFTLAGVGILLNVSKYGVG